MVIASQKATLRGGLFYGSAACTGYASTSARAYRRPRISNAFASASTRADANGLGFTSHVFGRIAQAQAGRTAMRLDTLAARNGY